MRKLALLLALAALPACGGGADTPEQARARFDATVAYLRASFERENGVLESAFLAEGTDVGGGAGQFVCGVSREGSGRRRAFMSPAIEGDATREVMTTSLENRDQRDWYRNACAAPVRDASGQEIRFEGDRASTSGAQPQSAPVQAPAPPAGPPGAEARPEVAPPDFGKLKESEAPGDYEDPGQ